MKKIVCPKCGEEFKPTRSGYDTILKQVRDREFQEEIASYKSALDAEKESVIKEATRRAEDSSKRIIADLTDALEAANYHSRQQIHQLENDYRNLLDFRARQTSKILGENLEQHCEAEFNKIRTAGFHRARFYKDNEVADGSKGDYIFRDFDDAGNEIISIMFEMKNESHATATKKRNEDFFKKLDKDRKTKKCEYAVLVSLLEMDNDFYNGGIADVSYQYPKMYVVRPQCFTAIITLLRNAALNAAEYKRELIAAKNRNIDMVAFEREMDSFKEKFGKNYRLASERFEDAIKEIDKSIEMLERVKGDLLASERNLRLANDKAQNLTMKKLTKTSEKAGTRAKK